MKRTIFLVGLAVLATLVLPAFGHAAILDQFGWTALIAPIGAIHLAEAPTLTMQIRQSLLKFGMHENEISGDRALSAYSWEDLHQERAAVRRAGDRIAAHTRDLLSKDTTESRAEYDALEPAYDYLTAIGSNLSTEIDKRMASGNKGPRNRSGRLVVNATNGGQSEAADNVLFRDKDGKIVRAYSSNERLSDHCAAGDRPYGGRLNAGHVLYRAVTGRWADREVAEEARALSIGTPSAGGYLVPEPLSTGLIDMARSQSVAIRAGALTMKMESNTYSIARIEADPAWRWKVENAANTNDSGLTFGLVQLVAKTSHLWIPMSRELWQDAMNAPEMLERLLASSLAAEWDRVVLHGTGDAQPTGLFDDANAGVYTLGAAPSNYDWVSQAVQVVETANHTPNALIMHPRTKGQLDRLKEASTNAPLQPPRSFVDLQKFTTTNVRTDIESGASPNDDSCAFVGKFNETLIGTRMDLLVGASDVANTGTYNALTQFGLVVYAASRMDVVRLRPDAFCVVKGIQNS